MCHIPHLSTKVTELLVEKGKHQACGLELQEGVYSRDKDGSMQLIFKNPTENGPVKIEKFQGLALVSPLLPAFQTTPQMGPEVAYIFNSMEDIVHNVMGNRQESCKIKEIEDLRKQITNLNKLHAAAPSVRLASEIKEVGCKLSKLIRDKIEQDMKDLREQQNGSKCKCVTDQHIKTIPNKPYDSVTNPNGFITDRSGPHNIWNYNIGTTRRSVQQGQGWIYAVDF